MGKNNRITEFLKSSTTLPLFVAPLFLNSTPELVLACAKEGFLAGIPAYGQWTSDGWDQWLTEIDQGIAKLKAENPNAVIAPYAANLIFKANNDRITADLDIVVKHRVPVVFASAEPTAEQIAKIHSYGGIVMHDIANVAQAREAIANGADGLIAITTGAGGQGSTMNPIALIDELRQFFDGPIALAGCMSTGHDILAAQGIGADFADMGTRFVATKEAKADPAYKQMIADSSADDIVYTTAFTGQAANFMAQSVKNAGYDIDKVRKEGTTAERVKPLPGEKSKAWVKVWAAGQGVGSCHDVPSVAELANRLKAEYAEAKQEMAEKMGIAAPAAKPRPRIAGMKP